MMEGLQKRPSLAAQPSMSAGFDLQTAIPAGQHAGNRMLPPSDITSPTSAAQQQGADAAGPFTSPGVAPHLGNGSLRGSKRPRHSNATEDPDEGEILDDSHPLLPSFAPSGGILLPPGGMSGGLNHSGSNHCGGGSASEASEHGPPAGSPSYSALGSARSLQPGQLQSPGQGHLPHRPWGAGPLSGPQQTHNVHSSGLQPPHSHFKPPPAPPPGPAPSSAPPHAIPINPLHGSLMSPRYGSSPVQGDGRGGAFAGTHGGMAYRPPQSQGPGSAGAGGRHSAPGQPGYPTHVQGQWHWRPAPQGRGMEKEGPQGHQPYQPYHSGGRAGAGRGGYFGSRGHH